MSRHPRDAPDARRGALEIRLRRLEERYQALIANLPDAVWTADADGRAVYISPRITGIFGFPPEEVYLQGEALWLKRIHPDDVDAVWAAYARLFAEGVPFDAIYRYLHRDGRWIWIHDRSLTTYEIDGVRFADGALTDITAQREADRAHRALEAQLRQSQKLEAVGLLAGGIAHDFNNLLMAIVGYAELLAEDCKGQPDLIASIMEILRAGDRAAALVRQLLAFSRNQTLDITVIDMSRLVEDLGPLLRRLISPDIDVRIRGAGGHALVRADKSQLEQVIVNLALNARDAMAAGGPIEIETSAEMVGAGRPPELSHLAPGSYVALSVRDSGHGMNEETARRALEPFFTTKGPGGGSGLGLSTSYGIVTQLGGALTITTAPDAGTTVRILLPAAGDLSEIDAPV
ncbi:MAG TPA: ATP-binding protein [Vicinamibacterales bacterium]|nr:ATP-binding protein [Vicinamibacterales bacterium]